MATTREERRRRWFLRTWAVSSWWAQWRATIWANAHVAPHIMAERSPPTRSWSQFAADVRVPMGVVLEVHQRRTTTRITVPLSDPFLLIGNSPACGLRLDQLPPGTVQFALFWLHGELYGVDLRRNAFDPEDHPLQDGWWSEGERLQLGEYSFQVRGLPGIPARSFPLEDQSTVTLHLESPHGRQEFHLTRWLTLIGCAPDHGVMIREAAIAARQAVLIRTPTSLWMVNLADGLPPRMHHRPVLWASIDPLDEFTLGETKCHAVTTWPENFFSATPVPEVPEPASSETGTPDGYRTRLLALHAELEQRLKRTDSST